MNLKFLIVPSVLMFQFAVAQNSSESLALSQGTATTPASATSSAPFTSTNDPMTSPTSSVTGDILIMDYKSVYEAPTLEEEVQMAADRFKLTQAQQEVWILAATDRRAVEKQVREKLDSKSNDYSKDGVYRALRTSHNTFYEAIIGYMNPAQKQALEFDRAVLAEKQKRIAKLPPPPPPAPTVTVAPVDSTAIKESEKTKAGKKSKKSKKAQKPQKKS